MLDVFSQDAFSVISLTDAINKPKFQPGRVGQLGLFRESGVSTTTIMVEERDGVLSLIPPTPRGAPGTTLDKAKRKGIPVAVPHFQVDDAVMAEEVQGVRAFGSETAVEMVMDKVADRMLTHRSSLEVTKEYARVGAVIGVITYSDSSTLDIFNLFGVSQDAEIDFDLDNANPADGVLRKKCASVIRAVSKNLDGVPFSGLHALCGDAFFDDLLAHKEVRATFLNNPAAAQLRAAYVANGQSYGMFDFGGITWENYRGYVGATDFVNTDKCHIFPTGVPNLFCTYNAPADYMETVNTVGRPFYAKQFPMPNDKGVNLEVQMNSLQLCTRPKALIKGKRT